MAVELAGTFGTAISDPTQMAALLADIPTTHGIPLYEVGDGPVIGNTNRAEGLGFWSHVFETISDGAIGIVYAPRSLMPFTGDVLAMAAARTGKYLNGSWAWQSEGWQFDSAQQAELSEVLGLTNGQNVFLTQFPLEQTPGLLVPTSMPSLVFVPAWAGMNYIFQQPSGGAGFVAAGTPTLDRTYVYSSWGALIGQGALLWCGGNVPPSAAAGFVGQAVEALTSGPAVKPARLTLRLSPVSTLTETYQGNVNVALVALLTDDNDQPLPGRTIYFTSGNLAFDMSYDPLLFFPPATTDSTGAAYGGMQVNTLDFIPWDLISATFRGDAVYGGSVDAAGPELTPVRDDVPQITLSPPSISGLSVTVTAGATPGANASSITSLSWDWGDGSEPGTASTATHTYAQAGSYMVTVTATDDAGGTNSESQVAAVGISSSGSGTSSGGTGSEGGSSGSGSGSGSGTSGSGAGSGTGSGTGGTGSSGGSSPSATSGAKFTAADWAAAIGLPLLTGGSIWGLVHLSRRTKGRPGGGRNR